MRGLIADPPGAAGARLATTETSLQNSYFKIPRWKRLPASYGVLVLPLLISVLMTAVISAVVTLKNVGFRTGVLGLWLDAWIVSWIIAFPTLLVVLPLVRKIVGAVVEQAQPPDLDRTQPQ